jgi:hypothetical protein
MSSTDEDDLAVTHLIPALVLALLLFLGGIAVGGILGIMI